MIRPSLRAAALLLHTLSLQRVWAAALVKRLSA